MGDAWLAIVLAVASAVLGGGSGFIVSMYQAKTDRRRTDSESEKADAEEKDRLAKRHLERERLLVAAEERATEVALKAWRTLAAEREREATLLRQRLTEVECRLTETERRLSETEHQLQAERDRNTVLENKVDALEKERDAWRRERAALMKRIEELEGCK